MEAPAFSFGEMDALGWVAMIVIAIVMFVIVKNKYKHK